MRRRSRNGTATRLPPPSGTRRVGRIAVRRGNHQLCEAVADRPGQDSRYWLDSSAIKKDVGWQPEVELEEGIKEMVEWGKKYLDQLKDWPMDYTLRA